ncbi:MerR family transcriptional regulator [Nonomuraea ferruginea]
MTGVSERTLRHYDDIGLLAPAAVDGVTGYRWYGVTELSRLERIRGLQRLGLPLRLIADLLDAPEAQLRQALAETMTGIRREIATLAATAARAQDHLDAPMSILPQQAAVGPRRLRVRRTRVRHPSELAALCPAPPAALLTWLDGPPADGFTCAVTTGRAERAAHPARPHRRASRRAAVGGGRPGRSRTVRLAAPPPSGRRRPHPGRTPRGRRRPARHGSRGARTSGESS